MLKGKKANQPNKIQKTKTTNSQTQKQKHKTNSKQKKNYQTNTIMNLAIFSVLVENNKITAVINKLDWLEYLHTY